MKIAITGASGHIGVNLCRMLADEGHTLKVLIHKEKKGLSDLHAEFIKGSTDNIDDLEQLCRGCEILFHLAAHISIKKNDPQCLKVNSENCLNVIHAARKKGIRRIMHFSSIHAFNQEPLNETLDESRELSVKSRYAYDKSKGLGQQIMLSSSGKDLEIVVLNPTAVIGPFDYKPSFLGNAVIRFYKGQNPGLIPGGYDWVDVRDVCSGAISAMSYGQAGKSYLLGGSWQSIKQLAREIHLNGGHPLPKLEFPMWLARASTLFLNLHALAARKVPLYTDASLHALKNSNKNISIEAAKQAFQYQPRPFNKTISDTIQWFRDNNYL